MVEYALAAAAVRMIVSTPDVDQICRANAGNDLFSTIFRNEQAFDPPTHKRTTFVLKKFTVITDNP